MKYALLTALLLALLLWVDFQSPLTGLTPSVAETDRAIADLQEKLARRDWPGAADTLATIQDGVKRSDPLLSLLASIDNYQHFRRLLRRIEAGLEAREHDGLLADAVELREVWHYLLSP